jgi:hypothetical protein
MNTKIVALAAGVIALGLSGAPAHAGLLDSGLGAVTGGAVGGGGAGGGSFSGTATELGRHVVVSLSSALQAVAKVQEATGNKKTALALIAQADEIRAMKEPKKGVMEKSLQAIESNPIKREDLAQVKNPEDKKKIVESLAHLAVAAAYDAKAVSAAQQLSSLTPGPADALNAPAILEVAQLVVTAFPKQISTISSYTSEVSTYASTNKLEKPTAADSRRVATSNGADPAEAGSLLN